MEAGVGAFACSLSRVEAPAWCGSCCLLPFQGIGSSMVWELLPLPLSGHRLQHGAKSSAFALFRVEGPTWCAAVPFAERDQNGEGAVALALVRA